MNDRPPVEKPVETLIRSVLIGSPVARSLGVELVDIAADRVVLRLPFSPDNTTVGTVVHGGVVATLIDIAAACVSAAGLAEVPGGGATANLAISYLAPADNTDLIAEAAILRRGKRQTVEEVTVSDAAGTPVARALVTSRIF